VSNRTPYGLQRPQGSLKGVPTPRRSTHCALRLFSGVFLAFTKCHVGDSPVAPAKYGIKSIPALIFFKEGKKVDQITGIVGKSKLEETINSIL